MTTIIAKTYYGVPIQGQPRFDTKAQAIRWAKQNADQWPGMVLVMVHQPPPVEISIWRDRSVERRAA